MDEFCKQVLEFNKASGIPVNKKPKILNNGESLLRFTLLAEELTESFQAYINNDICALAKELADVQYVLSQAIIVFGVHKHFQKVFAEVHKSNMSKFIGGVKKREDGKILKGDHYIDPDLSFIS